MRTSILGLLLALGACANPGGVGRAPAADEPLPSWHDGAAKSAIVAFVARVTGEDSSDFVPAPERVAVFDNDGTLWAEQPLYFQALYTFARLRTLATTHAGWRSTEPFKSALAGDVEGLLAAGKDAAIQVLLAAHAGLTEEEFAASVRDWLASARHPVSGRPFTELVYQPMLELLDYLRAHEFKVFIVSGGGVDFIRVFSEEVYGIPPEQVVGTTIGAKFELREGVPTVVKTPELVLLDDKAGKPVGIHYFIGRRPIFAAGNSDGDREMLQYTTIPRSDDDTTLRFGLLVHHTDAEREYAYDRESHVGRLDAALDEAGERGWVVVDMRADWARVHPAVE